MSSDDLNKLKELALAATNRPVHVSNGNQLRSAKHQIAKVWMFGDGQGKVNAEYLAAAYNSVPALLAENERHEDKIRKIRNVLKRYTAGDLSLSAAFIELDMLAYSEHTEESNG